MLDQISSTMDIQSMMICIGIVIISALLIYFIMMCTMREKSFEDVKREHQLQMEKERLKTRQQVHGEKKEKVKSKVRQRKSKVEKVGEKVVESYPELTELPPVQPKVEPVKTPKAKKGKTEVTSVTGKQAASVSPVQRAESLQKTQHVAGIQSQKVEQDAPTVAPPKEQKRKEKEVRPVAEVHGIQEEIRVEDVKIAPMREAKPKSRKVRAVEPTTGRSSVCIVSSHFGPFEFEHQLQLGVLLLRTALSFFGVGRLIFILHVLRSFSSSLCTTTSTTTLSFIM